MRKTWSAALATATLAMAVSACNTVAGAEEDVESVAQEVDEKI